MIGYFLVLGNRRGFCYGSSVQYGEEHVSIRPTCTAYLPDLSHFIIFIGRREQSSAEVERSSLSLSLFRLFRLPRRQVMHSPLPTSGNWTNPGNPATRRALSSCHWQLRVWEPGTSQPSARSRSWAAASPATQGRRRRPPYATSSSNSPSPLPRAMQHCLTTESLVTARRATRVLGGRVDILFKRT